MANNFLAKDATGQNLTFGSIEVGGVQYPIHYISQFSDAALTVNPHIDTDGTKSLLPFLRISTASNNAAVIKASLGQIGTIVATNNHSTNKAYLKLYNRTSAPNVGVDLPVQVYCLAQNGGGVSITFPTGLNFTLGIAMAITSSMDNINAGVDANQVAVSIGYQ